MEVDEVLNIYSRLKQEENRLHLMHHIYNESWQLKISLQGFHDIADDLKEIFSEELLLARLAISWESLNSD